MESIQIALTYLAILFEFILSFLLWGGLLAAFAAAFTDIFGVEVFIYTRFSYNKDIMPLEG